MFTLSWAAGSFGKAVLQPLFGACLFRRTHEPGCTITYPDKHGPETADLRHGPKFETFDSRTGDSQRTEATLAFLGRVSFAGGQGLQCTSVCGTVGSAAGTNPRCRISLL